MRLRLFYLGSLRGCNYHCGYCPFAHLQNSANQVRQDASDLDTFCTWVAQYSDNLEILFTPRGEALIWPHYQAALPSLSHLPHLRRLVIQTNLSSSLEWLSICNPGTLALWCTYHPEEADQDAFLNKLAQLTQMQILFSVGMVGKREAFAQIEQFRRRLPQQTYLWINAFKETPNYYSDEEIAWLTAIDPLFPDNLKDLQSAGKACRGGDSAFAIEGDGTLYRCHLIQQPLGNLYQQPLTTLARQRPCDRASCDCYIGNINLNGLEMARHYGDHILARIPLNAQQEPLWRSKPQPTI